MKPNYDKSIVNVMASIEKHFGGIGAINLFKYHKIPQTVCLLGDFFGEVFLDSMNFFYDLAQKGVFGQVHEKREGVFYFQMLLQIDIGF